MGRHSEDFLHHVRAEAIGVERDDLGRGDVERLLSRRLNQRVHERTNLVAPEATEVQHSPILKWYRLVVLIDPPGSLADGGSLRAHLDNGLGQHSPFYLEGFAISRDAQLLEHGVALAKVVGNAGGGEVEPRLGVLRRVLYELLDLQCIQAPHHALVGRYLANLIENILFI